MMILLINSGFFSLDCWIGFVFSISIRNKNATYGSDFLKRQKNAYQIEKDDGEFIYGVNKIIEHFLLYIVEIVPT